MRSFYLRLIEHGPENLPGWLLYLALWPISLLYRLVIWGRAQAYALGLKGCYRASVPVISVGNITAGGTGKTPVVDSLVKYIVSQGRKVAIVSRGYKGTFSGEWCRVKPEMAPSVTGDEPYLLAARNPEAYVYVARKRRHGVMAAENDGVDCIILDDAFQHLAVARDLDVLLLDARCPFGNGATLPAGYLREPRTALKRAGLIVMTHSADDGDTVTGVKNSVRCKHRFADHLVDLAGNRFSWKQLDGKSCMAFAGIAHPKDFFAQLRKAGCELQKQLICEDHQVYDPEMIRTIDKASQGMDYLLTTEKDAVKLHGAVFPRPCLTVPLELEFDNFSIISDRLDALLGNRDE